MGLDSGDYIKLVTADFRRKQTSGVLSLRLADSTRAKIKKECINVYKQRPNKRDERILEDFFGPLEEGKSLAQTIRAFDTDRFRPLDSFLKGQTEKTELKNIELLAWLIDFQPRPHVFGMPVPDHAAFAQSFPDNAGKSPVDTKSTAIIQSSPGDPEGIQEPTIEPDLEQNAELAEKIPSGNTPSSNKYKRVLIAVLTAVSFAGMGYVLSKELLNKASAMNGTSNGCMYWADTAYVEIPCSEQRNGMLTLPLDKEKMKTFKRIILTDTVTERSVGRIYYLQNNKSLELYTAGGNHPVEVTRSLRKLTAHMFNKYLGKGGKMKTGGEAALAGVQTGK
ncbi:MAG TPA: hypothetical protein VFR58_18135 [Flavisolibacter sp.]|nr:hypothetical protein [Flavisolibacter sp.]